jgi:integrase
MTVHELLAQFVEYQKDEREPKWTRDEYKWALRPLKSLFGDLPAKEFTPLKLMAVREAMICDDISRGVINRRIRRICSVFQFGVAREIVAETVYRALLAVKPIRRGRGGARETIKVRPVADQDIDTIRPHVSPTIWAMAQLMRYSGMRPSECCRMRMCDLDMSGPTWLYRPSTHKTQHLDHERVVALGPKCQQILRQFLALNTTAFLFSPKVAMDERSVRLRQQRRSKVPPSQTNRRVKRRHRPWGNCYTRFSLATAIARGCKRAGIAVWSPYKLRHAFATAANRTCGIEDVATALGHSDAKVTLIYARLALERAKRVAQAVG